MIKNLIALIFILFSFRSFLYLSIKNLFMRFTLWWYLSKHMLMAISVFCININSLDMKILNCCLHKVSIHQFYSSIIISSIQPPSKATPYTYFIVLFFIINSKVNVQKVSSMYPTCDYVLLWSVQPSLLFSLTPFLPSPLLSSFENVSFCPLPAQMWSILILLAIVLFSFTFSCYGIDFLIYFIIPFCGIFS
jgi:hypothetical protein